MYSSKPALAPSVASSLALSLVLLGGAAHAATDATTRPKLSVAAAMDAGSILGGAASAPAPSPTPSRTAAGVPVASVVADAHPAAQPAAQSAAQTSGGASLTLDQIDAATRERLLASLSGPGKAGVGSAGPAAAPTLPVRVVARPRPQAEPVTFVGSWRDAAGGHVLYDWQGGVYAARTGEKLLNGWTARKVDGFMVTVAEGRRTWTVPLSAGSLGAPPASSMPSSGGAVPGLGRFDALRDLASPLPPGGVAALGASPAGRPQ